MRIGIKISPLTVLKAGIPNYILNLLEAFARDETGNEYFLYTNRPLGMELGLPGNFRVVIVRSPSPRLQLWYQFGLPARMKRDRLDLFHDPVYPLPLRIRIPGVITVHDLSSYTDPGVHSLRSAAAARLYPRHLRVARQVITDSEYTASRIRELFPWASDKLNVVHLGVSRQFRKVSDGMVLSEIAGKYDLPEEFLLFLGTLEPRKNLIGLLNAFQRAADDIPHSLVIAGGLGWKYRDLMRIIAEHPRKDRIHLTGFVPDEELPALLSLARFLVYPSRLEGFGLPILEAMACGTPVMTSNCSSMPEIAGEAALLVDPLSEESMADGLVRMGNSPSLREDLEEKGLARASLFSWDDTARRTLMVYRKAVSGA
jgi:glycosyltransferase involved in cell wall biosynthesis